MLALDSSICLLKLWIYCFLWYSGYVLELFTGTLRGMSLKGLPRKSVGTRLQRQTLVRKDVPFIYLVILNAVQGLMTRLYNRGLWQCRLQRVQLRYRGRRVGLAVGAPRAGANNLVWALHSTALFLSPVLRLAILVNCSFNSNTVGNNYFYPYRTVRRFVQ